MMKYFRHTQSHYFVITNANPIVNKEHTTG